MSKGPVNNIVFKTIECKNYLNNKKCRYGNKCQYAHGAIEITRWEKAREKRRLRSCSSSSSSLSMSPIQTYSIHQIFNMPVLFNTYELNEY